MPCVSELLVEDVRAAPRHTVGIGQAEGSPGPCHIAREARLRQAQRLGGELPAHFRLYFLLDTAVMTPESGSGYLRLLQNIKQRPAYEVEIIGYTDTLGGHIREMRLEAGRIARAIERRVRLASSELGRP